MGGVQVFVMRGKERREGGDLVIVHKGGDD